MIIKTEHVKLKSQNPKIKYGFAKELLKIASEKPDFADENYVNYMRFLIIVWAILIIIIFKPKKLPTNKRANNTSS